MLCVVLLCAFPVFMMVFVWCDVGVMVVSGLFYGVCGFRLVPCLVVLWVYVCYVGVLVLGLSLLYVDGMLLSFVGLMLALCWS